MQSSALVSGTSRPSIHTTVSRVSLPWSCHSQLGVRTRSPSRMKGFERIFLPGEQSHERRAERTRLGVPVPPALLASLNQLGEKLGIGRLA